ncbi:MAG: dihydroorotate dehydrogenase [Archaeoglobus sp.]|nr:dihydroorotate dehydrogenase [Archaeoglobus sp.]
MLEVEVCGMKLKNPLMLASGILGSYASSLNLIAENAGAVVTKSIGLEPREGYRNPAVINLSHGILNAVGLASPGAKNFSEELKKFSKASKLVVSLFGSDSEDFSKLVGCFDMADAFELNLSCPHIEDAGLTIGNDPELVGEIVKAVKSKTSKPVFAKISALSNYLEVAKAAEESGADGIVAINTLKGMAIDIALKKPILSNISGGISGEAIKPIAMRIVWDLFEELNIPIIACGGATTWKDVVEFMLAGARAVQIGSAVFYSQRIFYSLKESLIAYLRREKLDAEDLIGAAHR